MIQMYVSYGRAVKSHSIERFQSPISAIVHTVQSRTAIELKNRWETIKTDGMCKLGPKNIKVSIRNYSGAILSIAFAVYRVAFVFCISKQNHPSRDEM